MGFKKPIGDFWATKAMDDFEDFLHDLMFAALSDESMEIFIFPCTRFGEDCVYFVKKMHL